MLRIVVRQRHHGRGLPGAEKTAEHREFLQVIQFLSVNGDQSFPLREAAPAAGSRMDILKCGSGFVKRRPAGRRRLRDLSIAFLSTE